MTPELEQLIAKEVPSDDSASRGEKMLLYWLIRELKPTTVIETGTHKAMATLYMAAALCDNGNGHIHTCDPYDWGARGNIAKFSDLAERITFYEKRGTHMLPLIEHIDFAFIDGFHGYHDVLPEIELLMPRLSKRATVVFHDCWYGDSDGVNEAVEAAGLQSLWLPTKNAIRIYQTPEERPTA